MSVSAQALFAEAPAPAPHRALKIVMATHYFGSHRGGVEIVADHLYHEFAALGHRVTWLAGDTTPPPEPIGTATPIPLPVNNSIEAKTGLPLPIPKIAALRMMRRAIADSEIVLIHDCLYLTSIAAYIFAKLARKPVVIVQHTVPNETGVAGLSMSLASSLIAGPMIARAEQCVFISENTRAFYSGASSAKTATSIFNGVDCDLYRPPVSEDQKVALRCKLGLPATKPLVLFVGRFVPKKGLTALQQMAQRRQGWSWALAGWGTIDPHTWRLGNTHIFSELQGASLAELYQASDVLVLPSAKEGFPLVIQEALASGLPVVCGEETARADSSLSGLIRGVPIFPGDDARTAAAFLADLDAALDSDRTCALAEQRRAFAVRRYSWPEVAEAYIKIAQRLIPVETSPITSLGRATEVAPR